MAIAFGAATKSAANSTVLSHSHAASGSDRYAIIGVYQNIEHSITAISYGAQTPTLIGSQGRLSVYGLVAPNTGEQIVSVTSNSSDGFVLGVTSWTGVHQDTPIGTVVPETNSMLGSISAVASSATGNLVVDVAVIVNLDMAAAAGQTERISYDEPAPDGHEVGYFAFGVSSKPGAASVTMTWTSEFSVGDNFLIAVPLIAASGGGGGPVLSNQNILLLGVG